MPHTFRKTSQWTLSALAGVAALVASTAARAQEEEPDTRFQPLEGLHLELDLTGGLHFFSDDLELGVADDPLLPSPQSPSGAFGLRLGLYFTPMFGIEAETLLIPTADNQPMNLRLWVLAYRAHAIVNFAPGKIAGGRLTPFVLAGVGALSVISTEGTEYEEIKRDTDLTLYAGAGLKYAIAPRVLLRFDARVLGVPNTTSNGVSPDFELLGSLGFLIGGQPPTPPPPPPPPPPPLVKDTDGDGTPDDTDKCPNEAGPAENGGCPDKDTDGDGVADRKDKCPEEAGVAEREGCPIPDKDKDGIEDEKDKCPDAAEDKDGFEDDDGCPDPDNDKDGVVDENDKCPTEAESKNGYQDDDGCPDEVPAPVKKFTGAIKGINFRRNSADIKASSFPLLKDAVKVFKEYPALRIEISGHTSTDGKRDFNMKLSKKRAEAVKAFLVSAGVEENRISTVGYGPDRPVEDNSTKEGMEKNRRIEFRLLSPEEKVEIPPPLPPASSETPPAGAKKPKKAKAPAKGAAPPPEGDPMPPL